VQNAKFRGGLAKTERYIPPSEEAEKFFGDSAPLKGNSPVR